MVRREGVLLRIAHLLDCSCDLDAAISRTNAVLLPVFGYDVEGDILLHIGGGTIGKALFVNFVQNFRGLASDRLFGASCRRCLSKSGERISGHLGRARAINSVEAGSASSSGVACLQILWIFEAEAQASAGDTRHYDGQRRVKSLIVGGRSSAIPDDVQQVGTEDYKEVQAATKTCQMCPSRQSIAAYIPWLRSMLMMGRRESDALV